MIELPAGIAAALRPIAGRGWDALVVVDSASSVDVWRPTVARLCQLLASQGGFRTVRTRQLSHADAGMTVRAGDSARTWSESLTPGGRQVVLVVTDLVDPGWHTGVAAQLLARWATHLPVAIVHLLPQRLWPWGGLSPEPVTLAAAAPGRPNRRLTVTAASTSARGGRRRVVVVPILGLAAEWWSSWARLVTAGPPAMVRTFAVFADLDPQPPESPDAADEPEQLSARASVLRFRTMASPDAFRLAMLLAAVPLRLPLMRHVRRELLPGSDPAILAKIMLLGLLRRIRSDGRGGISYDFMPGVRQELLAMGRRSDTVAVVRALAEYPHAHSLLHEFRAAVDDPDIDIPEMSPFALPYIETQEAVFRALAGRYSIRAMRLGQAIQLATPASQVGDSSVSGGDRVATSGSPPQPTTGQAPASRPQIWGSVPLRNPDFIGRDDLLEELRRRLGERGTTAVLPETLHGMGGVGKSQTVIEYIYRHAAEYDLVWWIPADQSAQITSSFVQLAKRFDLPSSSAEAAVSAILEALRREQPPFSRWLLVFDNADHPDVVSPFFPASGHIVVTSRNPEWAGVARTVAVDVFTRSESIELLRRRVTDISEDDADRIAEALGDLPLAVEQAAAWRAQTGMPTDEYLQLLDQHPPELLTAEATDGFGAAGYRTSVAAVWNMPLNRLRTDNPAALQLLQICAFFGPEPISRALFTGVRGVPVPDALAEAFDDPIKINRAIRDINRYSLAKIDHRHNTLQLHRLVQTVVRSQLDDNEQREFRHMVHLLLAHGDPNDPASSLAWQRYAQLIPHVTSSNAQECQDRWVRRLVINMVRYLLNCGDFDSAHDLAWRTLELWRERLGDTDADTLAMARVCGVSLRRLDRLAEAQALNERTYEQVRRTFGEDSELFFSISDALGGDMRRQGLFAKELDIRQDILTRARRLLGEGDPSTLRYANNLASSLRLNGRLTEARDLDEQTWQQKQVVLGDEHPDTFLSLNALAMDLRECGQWLEACQRQEQTLSRQREVIGENHPRTIGAMRNLAVARRMAGFHEAARELSEQCVRRYRRRHGDRHLDTITAEMSLSADLRRLEEFAESEKIGQQSHELFIRTHGRHHPYTLVSSINLAMTYRLMGEEHEAYELDQETLAHLRDALGVRHPFTLAGATNTASDLAALGDHTAALELDTETRTLSTEVLGPDHPSTLAVALNLSIDLDLLGRSDEAAILRTKTVDSLHRVLGGDHPAATSAARGVRANCDADTMQL